MGRDRDIYIYTCIYICIWFLSCLVGSGAGGLGGVLLEQQQQQHPQETGGAQRGHQLGEDGQAPVLWHVGQGVHEHVHDLGDHHVYAARLRSLAALVGLVVRGEGGREGGRAQERVEGKREIKNKVREEENRFSIFHRANQCKRSQTSN